MNILPHKSWHVRTKKNIARVRRDEEQARQEEAERLRRVNLAEHEARIELLRASSGQHKSSNSNSRKAPEESEYFNLFDNFKDKTAKDAEKDVENKVEQEKWEVKAGIFSYLDGRYKHESTQNDEWYLQSRAERLSSSSSNDKINHKDNQIKHRNDPLEDIKRNLAVMKKNETANNNSSIVVQNRTAAVPKRTAMGIECKRELADSPTKRAKTSKHKKREKKSKHKHKHRRKSKRYVSSSESDSSSNSSANDDDNRSNKEALIHRLRQERLEREKKERLRTQQLLQGPSQSGQLQQPPPQPQSTQKYNSQFNPHIARQNQQ